MRCAARHRLLQNNPGATILLVVFLVGALFFALGTVLVRRERAVREPAQPPETQEQRLELVERLTMVGQPWCVDELRVIREKDPDPLVRDAADAALMVIGSR
jgi:hypothetical protein